MSAAEYNREYVQFRTVDSAMGSEADIVIYDNPRSDGTGFTIEHDRLNVAHTRAIYAEFFVITGSLMKVTLHTDSPDNHNDRCRSLASTR